MSPRGHAENIDLLILEVGVGGGVGATDFLPGSHPIFWPTWDSAVNLFLSQPKLTVTLSRSRSDYDDWRPSLASLLQPIPFPKE